MAHHNHHKNHSHDHSPVDHFHEHDHEHTITGELLHHFPYAVFSAAFALVVVGLTSFAAKSIQDPEVARKGYKMLFHSFHFMHIVFAATGTLITFRVFAKICFLHY